jgi:hypothetical protein
MRARACLSVQKNRRRAKYFFDVAMSHNGRLHWDFTPISNTYPQISIYFCPVYMTEFATFDFLLPIPSAAI